MALRAFSANIIRTLLYLARRNDPRKYSLLTAYSRMCWKHFFLERICGRKLRSETILGFHVECFSYHQLLNFYEEIFVQQEYRFEPAAAAPRIIDCGSNIGMSVLYFKSLFPQARILAFEADAGAFAMLERNVAANRLSDVECRHAALYSHTGTLDFFVDSGREGDAGASLERNTVGKEKRTVQCERLSDHLRDEVDLLKVDIEGAEDAVFAELCESGRLALVREAVIEYHHHVRPALDRLSGFLGTLEAAGLTYTIAGAFPAQPERQQQLLIRARRRAAQPEAARTSSVRA